MKLPNPALAWLRRIVVAGAIALLGACAGSVELMAALPEAEANELLAVLLNAGIDARKQPGKEGMVSLHVEGGKVAQALDALRARGLPRERFAGMGEIFRKEGLISSPLEERVRYLYALAQELSNTISKIDGVMVARVHVVLPERGSAGDANTPSSAAVFIKYQDGYNLDAVQPQIRRLVTNSIPNLAAEKVSVIMVASQAQAQGGNGASSAGSVGPVVPVALQGQEASMPVVASVATPVATAPPARPAPRPASDAALSLSRAPADQGMSGGMIATLIAAGLLILGALALAIRKVGLPMLRARRGQAAKPGRTASALVQADDDLS